MYAQGVDYVVNNMRQKDKEEIFATRWSEEPAELTRSILNSGEFSFVGHADDGEPVVCAGAVPMWPGVWSVWMFATDRFNEIALSTTRFAKQVFFPALTGAGWHRLECHSLDKHYIAHKWLESLGAYKESEKKSYGKNGEGFFVYCWTKQPSTTHSN